MTQRLRALARTGVEVPATSDQVRPLSFVLIKSKSSDSKLIIERFHPHSRGWSRIHQRVGILEDTLEVYIFITQSHAHSSVTAFC